MAQDPRRFLHADTAFAFSEAEWTRFTERMDAADRRDPWADDRSRRIRNP